MKFDKWEIFTLPVIMIFCQFLFHGICQTLVTAVSRFWQDFSRSSCSKNYREPDVLPTEALEKFSRALRVGDH